MATIALSPTPKVADQVPISGWTFCEWRTFSTRQHPAAWRLLNVRNLDVYPDAFR